MSDIITPEEFDRIFDRIVWIGALRQELRRIWGEDKLDFYFNKFMCDWTYKVYYENQEYYVLTDAYFA
jgi:hypothetical protein